MPRPTVALSPQDELLRLTGTPGDPFEDVSAAGDGTAKNFGPNKAFTVRPVVGGAVTGAGATLIVALQTGPTATGSFTSRLVLANITASSKAVTGVVTAPPIYTLNTPPGEGWVRINKSLSGTTPVFNDFWLAVEPVTPY